MKMRAIAILSALLATGVVADADANGNGRNVLEAALVARQTSGDNDTETAYLNSVCLPSVTSPVIPPCQEITNIESACLPNGTSTLDLIAHAECMCGGSYFSDWIGCLNCDFVHGARSPAVVSAFHSILTTASNELCTGTPTAPFQSIFASLNYGFAVNATGSATVTSDLYPSQTAVSLYFTATGPQGPGQITGSATAATKVVSTTASQSSTGKGGGSSGSAGGSATAGGSGSSTSSSKAGAAATGVWVGGLGFVAGVAGMVVL